MKTYRLIHADDEGLIQAGNLRPVATLTSDDAPVDVIKQYTRIYMAAFPILVIDDSGTVIERDTRHFFGRDRI